MTRRTAWAGVVAALGAAVCLARPAAAQTPGGLRERTLYEDLQLFSQVLNQIRVNHPDAIVPHTLFLAAVEGMVRAADPHSYVIPAARLSAEKEKALRAGKLHPVAIQFAFIDGAPVVVGVAPGSAAARQDILPGDELLRIDDAPVAAASDEELQIALAGPRGAPVRLLLERHRADGSLVKLERSVARERVEEASVVPAAFAWDDSTGYVRVTSFASVRAADELHAALGRLEKQGMRRLILDLRGNGGGSVAEAAQVAGEFLPARTVVYTSAGRKPEVADTGRVQRSFWAQERRYPLVLLIDGATASAAELVAGALQDHDRALVVGRPSFGKALLMQGFPMADGSVIMLVIGHVRTPCGRVIQRQYQGVSRRSYYRLGLAERDTVGRPSCQTRTGRRVYGGGGIFPDLLLPAAEAAAPWVERVREASLPIQWASGYAEVHAASVATAEELAARPALPDAALAAFRAFARSRGVAVPTDPAADERLQRLLVATVAAARWGEAGYYRVVAAFDPDVRAAVAALPRAAELAR